MRQIGYAAGERVQKAAEGCKAFDARFILTEPSFESIEDLWVAVIHQAMTDATLGISDQLYRKETPKPKVIGTDMTILDIRDARRFIKGKDGALEDICAVIGVEYDQMQGKLIRVYSLCQEYLPEHWQDKKYMKGVK